jgi:hypothetical protein
MVSAVDQTILFTLPIELRQLIYKQVLASPLHGTELLATCRDIYMEAHEILFERPLEFRGQSVLFNWLDTVPHKPLSQTKELSITIQEADLSSLLVVPALIHHPSDPPRLLTWELYETELQKLYSALGHLPRIEAITIRTIVGRQSFLYRKFLRKFLALATLRYPHLLAITLEGNFHHQDLTFLSGFKYLQGLSFDGVSASSPMETVQILSGLKHFTSLSIVSQNTMLAPKSHSRYTYNSKSQSLIGGAVSTIDQLKAFLVTEVMPVSAPSLFLTSKFLTPLCNHQGLNDFRVCLSQAPSNETVLALEDFLGTTRIRVLSLDWPHLDSDVLKTFSLISECLKILWIRATSATDAFEIIWHIAENRDAGNYHALTELVILRSSQSYNDIAHMNDRKDSGAGSAQCGDNKVSHLYKDLLCRAPEANSIPQADSESETDTYDVVRAQFRLSALGTRVSWCTES